jgi:sugar lactone lactonase YvrE
VSNRASTAFHVFLISLALAGCGDDDAPAPDAGVVDAGSGDAGPPVDAGPRPSTFAMLGAASEGIALGRTPTGDSVLYVGLRDGRVVRVTPDGTVSDFAAVDAPVGIAVAANGDVLVCGSTGPEMGAPSVLFAIDPMSGTKRTLVAAGPGDAPLGLCNYVAVAPDDSIVFSDSEADRLFRADADGSGVALVTDAIDFPNGLAFSPDGATLYVASWAGAQVFALPFDRAMGAYGAPTSVVSGVENIDGLVALADGDLLLVTSAAGVQRVTPGSAAAVLYGPRLFMLPANGAAGDAAFGARTIYLTSLTRPALATIELDTAGVALPVR